MSSGTDTGPAVETVRTFIEAGKVKDTGTMKSCLTKVTIENGQLNLEGPVIESYTIGNPQVEGDIIIVPTDMKASQVPEGQPSEMNMPFVLMQEDGGWKIDLGKSVERMLGFNMEDMMEEMGNAMKGVMEGVADGMKQAFEGMGEAMSGGGELEAESEEETIEEESPEFIEAQRKFFEHIPREAEKIGEAIGRDVGVIAEWETFNNDVEAANKLAGYGLDRVRAAICLLNDDEQQALGGQLETIRFRYGYHPDDKSCVLQGSDLVVTCNPAHRDGVLDSDDIQKAIRQTLDLERGPALARLVNEFMPELNEGVKQATRVKVDHQVEIAGFMDMPDREAAVRAMKDLEGRGLNNWVYLMGHVHDQVALYDRLWSGRFEHGPQASQRVVFSDGNLLI